MKENNFLTSERLVLVKVNNSDAHIKILFDLLKNRSISSNISHGKLPSLKEHKKFIFSKPYRYWFLVRKLDKVLGSVYITRFNEISIRLKMIFILVMLLKNQIQNLHHQTMRL